VPKYKKNKENITPRDKEDTRETRKKDRTSSISIFRSARRSSAGSEAIFIYNQGDNAIYTRRQKGEINARTHHPGSSPGGQAGGQSHQDDAFRDSSVITSPEASGERQWHQRKLTHSSSELAQTRL